MHHQFRQPKSHTENACTFHVRFICFWYRFDRPWKTVSLSIGKSHGMRFALEKSRILRKSWDEEFVLLSAHFSAASLNWTERRIYDRSVKNTILLFEGMNRNEDETSLSALNSFWKYKKMLWTRSRWPEQNERKCNYAQDNTKLVEQSRWRRLSDDCVCVCVRRLIIELFCAWLF